MLVALDGLSKACKLISFPGLLTAFKTAEALFWHLFLNFGLLEDIVSN